MPYIFLDDGDRLKKLRRAAETTAVSCRCGTGNWPKIQNDWLIEETVRDLGFQQMYIEAHDNLQVAINVFEKCGYRDIPKPEAVMHFTTNRFCLRDLYKRKES